MSTISYADLQSETRLGRFAPVYLVLGPEDYQRRQALRCIRDQAVPPECRVFNLDEFSARNTGAATVLQAARTYPMMARRRLVIVHEADGVEEADQEEYIAYARAPEQTTVLVLTAAGMDKRTRYFKALLAHATCLEFQPLKGRDLEEWLGNYIRSQGVKVSPRALGILADTAGDDLQRTIMEVEKVLLVASPDRGVTEATLSDLVRNDRQRTVFQLTDALGAGKTADALRILATLLEGDEPPLVVLTMLARHFRQVLIVKEMLGRGQTFRDACRAAQVWKNQNEFVSSARSIDTLRVEKIYRSLAEVDLRIKSSVDPRMLLEQLICSV